MNADAHAGPASRACESPWGHLRSNSKNRISISTHDVASTGKPVQQICICWGGSTTTGVVPPHLPQYTKLPLLLALMITKDLCDKY